MTIADKTARCNRTHAALTGPVRRSRRIAMSRGGQMRASYEQAVRIRDAIVNRTADDQDLMRERMQGACAAAPDLLKSA
ncbi:hypothetical protein [Paraburkholderia azotifigens]|uniref:Uncharacterized protein n=1 Tax=Paraburkholderia azotifigens TaxID=2057004 RepID=A0ABU9RF31_9BURK|nr:hypothetical protein [Paraburkholderia azotifigens]